MNGEQVADTGNPGSKYDAGEEFFCPRSGGSHPVRPRGSPQPGRWSSIGSTRWTMRRSHQNYGVKGAKIADPGVTPDHYGYAFDGKWYKDEALTRQWDFSSDTVPTNLTGGRFTLYAGLREMYYNVSFEPNGSHRRPAQQVREGKTQQKTCRPGHPKPDFPRLV